MYKKIVIFAVKTELNMIQQIEFTLRSYSRGFHLITNEIVRNLPQLPCTGVLNLFIKHTSAGLSL